MVTRRSFAGLVSAAVFAVSSLLLPARADDRPPQEANPISVMAAQAKISASIEFGLPALDRALERHVPRRLATFNDRATLCWHRRILRREVDIDCEYSGFVEWTGPISLRAERGSLERGRALVWNGCRTRDRPVCPAPARHRRRTVDGLRHRAASVAAGLDRCARYERRLPVGTTADPENPGFRSQPDPFCRAERVREEMQRVQADAAANLRSLDLRGKAETAWRHAFQAVKIIDAPEVWLQMAPQTVAFAGMHAHGNVLEGSLEITGTATTTIGAEPTATAPTPLPALGTDVTEPGRFEIVLPVNIDYDAVRAKIQEVATAMNNIGPALREIKVRPSADKVVIGLRLAGADTTDKDGDWLYLTATPRLDAEKQTIAFPDIAVSTSQQTDATPAAALLKDDRFLQSLRQQLQVRYQAELDKIVASANARLTRSLGDGFRSEAHLTSSGVGNMQLLASGMRVDFRAGGDLKILYGL